jgi:predicted amidohydrolase YtcJ
MRWAVRVAVAGVLVVGATLWLPAQEVLADIVLLNGKILTVDERFTIVQAAAIKGDRIVRVGTDREVTRAAGPSTRRIDLRGRTVIPGLIDNHMHLLRAGTTWQSEVRLDGVSSRKQALALLQARVRTARPGDWVYTLGGWAVDQFSDNPSPLSRAELDEVAPDNPVLLQASYYASYLNSRAIDALGLGPDAPAWAARDASGRLTGVIAEAGIRSLAARLPVASGAALEASTRLMIRDLNTMGLTAFGSAGCEDDVLPVYRRLAEQGELNVRVFCITGQAAGSPAQVDGAVALVPRMKLLQGDSAINHVAFGESVYGPLHDPMFVSSSAPRPDELLQWRRIATEVARARLPLHVHANLSTTISAFLDQIEIINAEHPISGLRWTLAHVNQLTPAHLARMKKLGVAAAVHPWAIINGGINRGVFGDAALDMTPLKTLEDSGVIWGLGSDGSRANQIRPFTTLWWAVTGRMVGGATVMRQPISREAALVAHTRRNAYFVFQEANLGSIEPGKLADLLVLDRDYLTVPADQIKDIAPVMTMVGGRIAYDASTR